MDSSYLRSPAEPRTSTLGSRASTSSHVIVLGGGIAGLCTVRALSERFERITLVERDSLPRAAEHRAGVPQSHHVHALLLRGLLELERLFPGIEQELKQRGAAPMDIAYDFAHCTEWGWARRGRTGVAPLTLSRLLLESVVRERVLSGVRNLTVLDDTRATGLCGERHADRFHVTGLTTSNPELREISADLVVDASGRGSKCLDWLEAHGVERPEEEKVDSFSGYASRFYQLEPRPERWWRGMLIDSMKPTHPRWGLLMPIENGRSVLTLGGINGEYPAHDEAGFNAHLHKLLSPALAYEIARATPLSGIHSNRSLFSRARHFERWSHEVAGFVSIGDSAIGFNPYHGQGMSMAALSANLLAREVRATRDPYALTRRFQRAQWRALRTAWSIATGLDLEWPLTEGKKPFGYNLTFGLGVAVVRASAEDPEVKRLIGPVYQLVAPPYTLLQPELVGRVLYASLRRRLQGPTLLASRLDTSAVCPKVPVSLPEEARGVAAD